MRGWSWKHWVALAIVVALTATLIAMELYYARSPPVEPELPVSPWVPDNVAGVE